MNKRETPVILGIIPARRGSKRLPGKNIKKLNGKPLISYVLEAAQKVAAFHDIIVSTDCRRIAGIARKYGASVPFLRPKKYADDQATAVDVISHAVKTYERAAGVAVDIFVYIQPTTPTTTAADIRGCIHVLTRDGCDSAITVVREYERPEWCGILRQGKFKKYFTPAAVKKMRDVEWYAPSGGVYAAKKDVYLKEKTFYTKKCGTVVVPLERNTDIDTVMDFRFAEFLLQKRRH